MWEALDDFGAVQKYHPTVEKSGILNGIARGEGAQRVCQFYDGSAIKERITVFGRLLQGLDDHLRTGKEVGRGGRLAA